MEHNGLLTQILELFNECSRRIFRLEQRDWKFTEQIMAIKATAEQTRVVANDLLAKVAAEHTQLEAIAANVERLEALVGDVQGAEEILSLINAQLGDTGNRVEGYSELFKKPDTIPPSTPADLAGNATSGSDISLTCSPSTDNVALHATEGYEWFNNGVSIGFSAVPSITVSDLTPATTYLFSVRSKDAAGNLSAVSESVSVPTLDTPIETQSRRR